MHHLRMVEIYIHDPRTVCLAYVYGQKVRGYIYDIDRYLQVLQFSRDVNLCGDSARSVPDVVATGQRYMRSSETRWNNNMVASLRTRNMCRSGSVTIYYRKSVCNSEPVTLFVGHVIPMGCLLKCWNL